MDLFHGSSSRLNRERRHIPLHITYEAELLEQEVLLGYKGTESCQFSLLEYASFFTIGMSMMWTWSMILQAVPYFQQCFKSNIWILRNFQAYNLVVFAITISVCSVCLKKLRAQIHYTNHLKAALCIYLAASFLLTVSTIATFHTSAEIYFPFLLLMVLLTGIANSLSQHAAFAFVAGFGRREYAPAIMTGEAFAGLLPSVIEILSALTFPSTYFDEGSASTETSVLTITYFFSGILLGIASLLALKILTQRSKNKPVLETNNEEIKMEILWRKLKWPASGNFLCLCISSVSPVFASKVLSTVPEGVSPILQRPAAFIPLAIVLWNTGDLFGSIVATTSTALTRRPFLIFILSLARIVFIPLYLMCNIDGRGSFTGDWFYLIIVQFSFGLTHGWLSATSMSGVVAWIDEAEREAAGAFMGLTLVVGLVVGSLLGLAAAQI